MNKDDDIDKIIEDKKDESVIKDEFHMNIFDDDEIDDGIEHIMNKYASLNIDVDADAETVDEILNRIMARSNSPHSYYGMDYLHSSKEVKDLTSEVLEEAFEGDATQTQVEAVGEISEELSIELEENAEEEPKIESIIEEENFEGEIEFVEEDSTESNIPLNEEISLKNEVTFEGDEYTQLEIEFEQENTEEETTFEEDEEAYIVTALGGEEDSETEVPIVEEDKIENETIVATDEETQTESKDELEVELEDELEDELRIEVTAEVHRESSPIAISATAISDFEEAAEIESELTDKEDAKTAIAGDVIKEMSTASNEDDKSENNKNELKEENNSNEKNSSDKNSSDKNNSNKKKSSKKKKKKSKVTDIIYDIVRYAIMGVALFLFGYAAYELTLIYVESREAEELKSSTTDMFYVSLDDLQENYEPPTNSEGETISLENENDGKLFVFDYKKMLSYNSHSKGYIRQDNGEYIDNPILQHPTDNEYYLSHLVDHRKSSVGAIYIDTAIEEGLNAKNCIIYGHNIAERAGKIMFGSLNWYWNKTGYYKEHPTFDIWIEDTRYKYYVFAIYKTEAAGSPVYQYAFSSDEEFMEYVKMCKENSKDNFKTAPKITKDSYIITLSTCTHSDDYRMIVQLVRGEELDIYGNPVESSN